MTTCKTCNSNRIASVNSKASDLHYVEINGNDHDGYLPYDMGIGGEDYVEFEWCLNCGQIQGTFPLPLCELETEETEDSEYTQ